MNLWDELLEKLRAEVPAEDFRRFFGQTSYASDAGDQLTVWVPAEAIRRHISVHFDAAIERALKAAGRPDTHVRFVVGGSDEDEEE